MFKPELLSPAGSLKNMRYAFAYGADAVYAGIPRYSLRVRNNEFDINSLHQGILEAHKQNKKFYVVCNIQPHNTKIKTFIKDIEPIINMKPDALIMSDTGLIMLVKEHFPEMPIHLSVQANAVNWATVKFWGQYGIERVIVSRELSIKELKEIREYCPDVELEIFVHGALCMAYSGRCLLSGYMNKRDSNQGTCTNACRWKYNVNEAKEDDNGNIVSSFDPKLDNETKIGVVTEQHRPNEPMSVHEDDHGTYIFNSKDLMAVQHIEELSKIGIHSFKIEGRTKSFYYCARTAQVYRKAIDNAVHGRPFDPENIIELEGLANRGYTDGFLKRHSARELQNYKSGYSISQTQQFVGEFTGNFHDNFAEVFVKNKFCVGDSLEIMTPKGNLKIMVDKIYSRNGENINEAKGSGYKVLLPIPDNIDIQYALLIKHMA